MVMREATTREAEAGRPSGRPPHFGQEAAAWMALQSERDELAAEVTALRRQLLSMQKSASLGDLLGTTTHEFNNALTTILNYAKMGLRHKDEPTRDKALSRILSASTRAAKITASVLGMARSRSTRMEPVELEAVIEDALVPLERELMKYRVHVNLMVNARKAMQNGGRLILRLALAPSGQGVDLTVRDTGCGMTPDVMRKMFEPNFSTKSGPDETGKGGSGLGLAACLEIIEGHRGRVRVESTPGKGTAITVRFPLS
jgi:signal transduction histidine kinase